MTYGAKIRAARIRAGLTQGQVDRAVGRVLGWMSIIERQEHCSTRTLHRIAPVLGTTPVGIMLLKEGTDGQSTRRRRSRRTP